MCSQSSTDVSRIGALLRQPGRADQDVEASVSEDGPTHHLAHGGLVGDVGLDWQSAALPVELDDLRGDRLGAFGVDVRHDDVRAELRELARRRAPDPAGPAGDHGDAPRELASRWSLRELVALERPVLDREGLGLAEGAEAAEGVRRVLHRDRPVVQVPRGSGRVARRLRS